MTSSTGNLDTRVDLGHRYLRALERSLDLGWHEYAGVVDASGSWVERLALVHPWHYEHAREHTELRGPRQFSPEVRLASRSCEARLLWGYECDLNVSRGLAADHLFPFSLGGPTTAPNKIFLCSLHNTMKANDIHVFPWERGEPEWLELQIEKVRRAIARTV